MAYLTRLAAAGTLAAALAAAPAAQAELKRITVGTNPSGSAYFMLGSGFAKLFQEKLGIRSTAQPHQGSSIYLPLLDKGEMTLGVNSSLDSGLARNGTAPFTAPLTKVRTLARIWVLPYAYIVKESSGIKKIEDFRGKKVVIDIKSVVSLSYLNKTILATAGLKESDVVPVDSSDVVKDIELVVQGRADAATVALAMPALRKAHAAVPGGLRVIPLGDKATDEFMAAGISGSSTMKTAPGKLRPFVPNPMTIAAFDALINAGASVTEEDAYKLAKTVHENWPQMQKDYAPLRGVKQGEIAPPTNPMPYHPGAVRYYKEAGLWTEANEKQQARYK